MSGGRGGAGRGLGRGGRPWRVGAGACRGRGACSQARPGSEMAGAAPPRRARPCPMSRARLRGRGIPSAAAGGTVSSGPCLGMGWALPAVPCCRFWPQPPADVSKLMTPFAHQKLRNGLIKKSKTAKTETPNAFALSGGPCFFSASAVNSAGSYLGTSPWLRIYPMWRCVRGRSYSCSSVLRVPVKSFTGES